METSFSRSQLLIRSCIAPKIGKNGRTRHSVTRHYTVEKVLNIGIVSIRGFDRLNRCSSVILQLVKLGPAFEFESLQFAKCELLPIATVGPCTSFVISCVFSEDAHIHN